MENTEEVKQAEAHLQKAETALRNAERDQQAAIFGRDIELVEAEHELRGDLWVQDIEDRTFFERSR